MADRPVPDPVPPILVRPEEAARLLSISVQFLYQLKDRGRIIFYRLGGATVLRFVDLEALAASLPAVELDMAPTNPLLPFDQRQLAGERASEQPPKRKRGRLRRPWPEPAVPEPEPEPEPESAPAVMQPTGPLLPLDRQDLAAKRGLCEESSPPDGPPPGPDFAALYESRCKLLIGNVGPDEARFRSFEFTVNAYRAHFGVDLEVAKKMVTEAIRGQATP